jgi:hypothetical protein
MAAIHSEEHSVGSKWQDKHSLGVGGRQVNKSRSLSCASLFGAGAIKYSGRAPTKVFIIANGQISSYYITACDIETRAYSERGALVMGRN